MRWIVVLLALFCLYQGRHAKDAGCPKNLTWDDDIGRCYYISDYYATFDLAKKYCESKNWQFASVSTHHDELLLSSILAPERDKCDGYGNCLEFWIGVRDVNGNNKWTTVQGKPVDKKHQFWAEKYPKSSGRCVLMSFEDNRLKGLWKNEYCERQLKFACITEYLDGFTYVPEINQYLYLNLDLKTWADARLACAKKAKGAQTLMIKDSVKQEAVRKYLEGKLTSKESQICAKHKFPPIWGKVISTSGQTNDPKQCKTPYVWKPLGAPSIPFTYTNWRPNMPNCRYPNENCAIIITSSYANYQWDDVACDNKLCSICEL